MVRNAILFISTLAVLLLLFVGYSSLVGGPARDGAAATDTSAALPMAIQVADEKKLPVGPVDLEPGERMALIRYDQYGRPIYYIFCDNWERVAGTQNELAVFRPELVRRLPSGMILTVTAERGQISVDRVDRESFQPKLGWVAGNARIVIDRETSYDRTPLSERPEDRITIETDRLDFDLELGELKTDEPLHVTSPEFEITGTGLHLVWNQADNRVEKLVIEKGGQIVLEGDLLNTLDATIEERGHDGGPPATTRPPRPAAPAATRENRQLIAYRCVFSDGVTVDHYVGDERLGGLRADELVLLFDVGGDGRGFSRREKPTTTAPASRPIDSPPKRLVVRWNGRLALGLATQPRSPKRSRRQFEARGRPVAVELPNGSVECGRLVLHQETKRLWLYPAENGLVKLSSPENLLVKAAGLFADLENNVVKLLGDVTFDSGVGAARRGQPLTIRCNLWAELHLAPNRDKEIVGSIFDNPLASRPPESALFVGDVQVKYEDQTVRAHRLDAHFRRPAGNADPDTLLETAGASNRSESVGRAPALLESAVASGDVRLTVADSSANGGWRRVIERCANSLKRALLRSLSKTARAEARRVPRDDRSLECARLRLDFAVNAGKAYVREMEGTGAVVIFDRDSRFAARGQRVAATFTGRGELERATVGGSERVPALVRARAYALRGKEIKIDNQARTLHVDGRSRLAFRSRRSLRGRTRRAAETIIVTSNESLHVDEQQNTVDFIGQVVAGTGDEQLLADTLTLLLEDAKVARPPPAWSQLRGLVRMMRGKLFDEAEPAEAPRLFFATTRSRGGERKELAHVLARNAVIQSETHVPGDDLPLVHQSIAAPELESDVRRGWIRTIGETTLLMTDRRLPGEAESTRSVLGIPSALMTRGPSQTAMECNRSLLYVLGEEGPQRKDSVLLEGGVRLRHVAGREMVNLEQMLPEIVKNPELLETLKSRNTYMECGRLEAIFTVADDSGLPRAARRLRPALQPSWLNARENVYLRDQQDDNIRSVYAHQLEYDRPNGVIRVLGSPEKGIDARVYDENPETGRFNIPAIGPEIIINLETNTIRTKEIRGQAGGGTR